MSNFQPTASPTAELLLQHVTWTGALARRLVKDAGEAEDLAQETLRIALERPPSDATGLRSWLGTVMRNLSREQVRKHANRRAREAAGARPEAQPATDELVSHLHTQRLLADTLLALDEPLRSTLLLRFYEELPPRAIAAKQGVPVATVKSRINRGLARLREALDERHGGERRSWALACMPLVAGAEPAWKVGLFGTLMKRQGGGRRRLADRFGWVVELAGAASAEAARPLTAIQPRR